MTHEAIPEHVEKTASLVIDSAIAVHRQLGPGLLESVYETCLCHELCKRNVNYQRQIELPVEYDGHKLDAALCLDVLANDCVIVELKAVEKIIPLYKAQVLTYLKLTGKRLGLLINFNVPLLKDGLKRVEIGDRIHSRGPATQLTDRLRAS